MAEVSFLPLANTRKRASASREQVVGSDFLTLESQVDKIVSSWANVQQHMTRFYIGHVKSLIVQIADCADYAD